MSVEGASLVRRFVEEVTNRGNTGQVEVFVADYFVGHDTLGDHYGPDGVRVGVEDLRRAFPDVRVVIDDLLTENDRVAHRSTLVGTHRGPFLGLPATGRVVRVTGFAIDRIADGRLVERWTTFDALDMMRQLGARPVLRP